MLVVPVVPLTGAIFRNGTTTCDTNSVLPVSDTSGTTSSKYIIYRLLLYLALVVPLGPLICAIFRSGTTTYATHSVLPGSSTSGIIASCDICATN